MPVATLVAAHVGLLSLWNLGGKPIAALVVLGVSFAAFAWASSVLEQRIRAAGVLAVATLLRLILVPLPATLSDDILRYQWDGRVVLAGENPYALAPDALELEPLRDTLWQRLPHKEVPAVYPPAALFAFSIASVAPEPVIALKLLLVAADLLGCWLLMRLAGWRGQVPGRALWYAWNPLVTLEVAGMGHVDALMVPAMIATVLFLVRGRPGDSWRAGVAAALGVLVKLVPAFTLAQWTRQSRRPVLFALTTAGVLALSLLPVVLSVGGVPPGLVTYGVSWEFDGPLYEPLWRALDALDADLRIKDRLDALKVRTGWHERLNHVYPYVYPQLLAKLVLAAAFAGFWLAALAGARRADRPRSGFGDPVAGSRRVLGALIVCSATVYPWYLLWILPWAALDRSRAWLVLSGSIMLSYLPQHADIALMPWVYLAVWLPFMAMLVFERWSSS